MPVEGVNGLVEPGVFLTTVLGLQFGSGFLRLDRLIFARFFICAGVQTFFGFFLRFFFDRLTDAEAPEAGRDICG